VAELAAAIDCGTNSTRLLIGDGTRAVVRRARVTGLGRDVDRTGALADDSIERTLATLREYRDLLGVHRVTRLRVVATSATRDAANRNRFVEPAADLLGTVPEVLAGPDEGRWSFLGATAALDPASGPFAVVDLGGGSTEFAVGVTDLEGVLSIDMGSIRFLERYLPSDPPRPEELSSALSVAEAHLDDVARELPAIADTRTWVGVGGTFTTVAAVELGLEPYDPERVEGFALARTAAEDVFRTLVTEPLVDRIHNPGLPRERAEVIVGGITLVVAIMRHFGIDPMLVSERDLLDGLVAAQLGRA